MFFLYNFFSQIMLQLERKYDVFKTHGYLNLYTHKTLLNYIFLFKKKK